MHGGSKEGYFKATLFVHHSGGTKIVSLIKPVEVISWAPGLFERVDSFAEEVKRYAEKYPEDIPLPTTDIRKYVVEVLGKVSIVDLPVDNGVYDKHVVFERINSYILHAEPMEEYISQAQEAGQPLSPASCIIGFVAWLTTRKQVVEFGSSKDSSVPCALMKLFCQENNIEIKDGDMVDVRIKYPD